jgi:DNA-binding transcriptional regulator LsrR (DeoR family)
MKTHKYEIPDSIIMNVCELWFKEKLGPTEIKNKLYKEQNYCMRRETIYAILKDARDRGFIRMSPPTHDELSWKLSERYAGSIEVVSTGDFGVNHLLAAKTAELVINRIKHHGSKGSDSKVRLGLGAGPTTRNIAFELANLYHADPSIPDIVIHALTSGFRSDSAHLSPISWFSLFTNEGNNRASFVGLFAPPMVPSQKLYETIKKLPGISEAFEVAKDINIVVTSIGNAADSVGGWLPYVEEDKKTALLKSGWCGDVLYCPYSDKGPIHAESLSLQAVTLFTIQDLVSMARNTQKHSIILVCGPSHAKEGKLKTKALKPLLENPNLRVWTHLITDMGTAQELIKTW